MLADAVGEATELRGDPEELPVQRDSAAVRCLSEEVRGGLPNPERSKQNPTSKSCNHPFDPGDSTQGPWCNGSMALCQSADAGSSPAGSTLRFCGGALLGREGRDNLPK